jgi:hypothetical protein
MSDETKTLSAQDWYAAVIGLQFAIAELSEELYVDMLQENPRTVLMALRGLKEKADQLVEQMRHDMTHSSVAVEPVVAPHAIDPGEGYYWLPVGTVLEEGDAYKNRDGGWTKTTAIGTPVYDVNENTYRRKIKTDEVWPKWYTLNYREKFPFGPWCIKRLSPTDGIRFELLDGKQTQENVKCTFIAESWIEVTEAEALARVTPHEPVDSPDDWMTQDRVPARDGIDQRRYKYSDHEFGSWDDAACMAWGENEPRIHGTKHGSSSLELRCRRKDLPVKQPATERIPDHRPARDVIMDIVQWLDPHPPVKPNPKEALDCAEQWLVDNPVDRATPATKRVPVRLYFSKDDGVVIQADEMPDDRFTEIHGSFYVEVTE